MSQMTLMLKLNSNFVKFIHADGYAISYLDIHYHSNNIDELRCLVERVQISFEPDIPFAVVQMMTDGLKKMKWGIRQKNVSEFSYQCGETVFSVSAIILFADTEEDVL